MKTLTVAALLCAVMALTTAAVLSDVKEEQEAETLQEDHSEVTEIPVTTEEPQEGEHAIVKRSAYCPCGWTRIYRRCFCFVRQSLSWAQAERKCQSMGANLASVHRGGEYFWIRRLIKRATGGHPQTWIGGSDGEQEGRWFWSDGTHFRFSYWCKGEPSNFQGRQDCAVINYGGRKCWDDQGCGRPHPSVCVKKP